MGLAEDTDLMDLAQARTGTVASSLVSGNAFRLDASTFLNADSRALVSLAESSGKVLADIADVHTVYLQTPILHYVAPFAHSRAYLTTSELGEYQRGVPAHVSLLADPRLIEWQVQRNTIILSRSGRVGEAYWVDKKLAGALVGDSFRIVPRMKADAYFVYALLASSYARDYVTGVAYGSVVDHASVEQVRCLPVPVIAPRARARIDELVKEAVASREVAYDLLDAAEDALLRANALGELRDPGLETPFDPLGQPECFTAAANEARATNAEASGYRLDAHFYNPRAQLAVASIKRCRSTVKTIAEVTARVFFCNRFTRTFVDEHHGMPYLAGKDIVQVRPTMAYLSTAATSDLDQYRLKRGWILMTCSGTLGRSCLVWMNHEESVGTHDLIRVVPEPSRIDGGYLYAFLSSVYGEAQVLRYRHGSVIDHVTPGQVQQVLVPCPSPAEQKSVGDMVREAYEKRADALRLEDEAQVLLMKALSRTPNAEGA